MNVQFVNGSVAVVISTMTGDPVKPLNTHVKTTGLLTILQDCKSPFYGHHVLQNPVKMGHFLE